MKEGTKLDQPNDPFTLQATKRAVKATVTDSMTKKDADESAKKLWEILKDIPQRLVY